jgi:ATP phosphoribosyltransferase regulatory subunit
VILPIPSGTRDVLPDEMRELRVVLDALRGAFTEHGYGEVATPALEYEAVLDRAQLAARPAYRVVDDHGEVLVLRTDMTVPIARVVASRFAGVEPPLRLCYIAPVYRTVRPHRGMAREFLQAGIELVGAPSPSGTAEALTLLCRALEAVGLRDFRIGVGSAAILPALLGALDVPDAARGGVQRALAAGDFVALEREVDALGLAEGDAALVLRTAQARGGPEVLTQAEGPAAAAVAGLRAVHALLQPDVAARLVFDLGLVRELGYYTGVVFEVYDPALGAPLGGGGRYDDLLGRFGRALPAVGFALRVDDLHAALTAEERA